MRRIAHVSDLHFGTEAPAVVAALTESIRAFAPHLVVATGDLTQRARAHEFESAQRFLAGLGAPLLVVPGNHDIAPLWRPLERALGPFERYRRQISPVLDQTWQDDELLVLPSSGGGGVQLQGVTGRGTTFHSDYICNFRRLIQRIQQFTNIPSIAERRSTGWNALLVCPLQST